MSAAPAIIEQHVSLAAALAYELASLADSLRRITVRIHSGAGRFDAVGAGVLWPGKGRQVVLTNAHVVSGRRAEAPRVESATGAVVAAHLIAQARELDLALLEVSDATEDLGIAATIGRSRDLRVGELVVALGHPLGVDNALSVGIVHAVPNGDDEWLRADVRLAPGNSGGPLATLEGKVVGINSMIVRGLGFAIPTSVAERFVSDVLTGSGA